MIKQLLMFLGLSPLLLVGCSTPYVGDGSMQIASQENAQSKGVRYLLGRGVPQDDAKAFSYFKQAAEDDDPFAQNELAYLYAAGRGTTQDYSQAIKWYQKAAANGLASAQYNLGLLYVNGMGTAPNRALGYRLFRQSAAHGFEPARLVLQQHRS
jgi:TPR repeat protein